MHSLMTSDRIILCAVEQDDANFMWHVETDSSQWIHNCMAAPLSKESLYCYALSYDANPYSAGQLRLIIWKNEHGKATQRIGIIDLYEISAQHHTAFVGIYILPSLRRKGYAMDALRIICNYSLRCLNLRQLGARIVSDNSGCISLFEKVGFRQCGVLLNWIQSGNRFFDLHMFQKALDSSLNEA